VRRLLGFLWAFPLSSSWRNTLWLILDADLKLRLFSGPDRLDDFQKNKKFLEIWTQTGRMVNNWARQIAFKRRSPRGAYPNHLLFQEVQGK